MNMEKILHFLGTFVILLGVSLIVSMVTMLLWNSALVPALTVVRPIENVFQMLGINALCYVLFHPKVHLLKKVNG